MRSGPQVPSACHQDAIRTELQDMLLKNKPLIELHLKNPSGLFVQSAFF